MGKVKTIDTEKEALKAAEKAQKEAERLAKIEAARSAASVRARSFPSAQAHSSSSHPDASERAGQTGSAPSVKAKTKAAQSHPGETTTSIGSSEDSPVVISNDSEKSQESQERGLSSSTRDDKANIGKKLSKYAAKKGSQQGRERSENYKKALAQVDKSKHYPVTDALALLEKIHLSTFDETVELHITTASVGISGTVTLPHGTGKSVRVAILAPQKDPKAAAELLKEIEAGKITFDVLVATPDAMPTLAKVAKILGPKGLMPNPKAGTVTPHPEAVAKSYAGGQMRFKTEAKSPVMHVSVGKLSFGKEKLAENITAFLSAVKMENIKKVVVKSTMSPSVRLFVK